MKTSFIYSKILAASLLLAFTFNACQDKCMQTVRYWTNSPVTVTFTELRSGVGITAAQVLEKLGKIYVKDNYLFINELKKGIHIFDNTDPRNPIQLSFLKVPGNFDMAVKGNTLYADSYSDFVAFDISNPTQVKELNRIQGVFQSGQINGLDWFLKSDGTGIQDYKYELVTTTHDADCDQNSQYYGYGYTYASYGATASSASPSSSPSSSGTGGSTARFAVVNDFLYAVSSTTMQLFDIQTPASPKKSTAVNLGWGIETIFPYKDKLFIGSTTGMFIYDNVNPQKPTLISQVNHFRACDPVVVEGNYAYVTLRNVNAGPCGSAPTNQLDVIDISNIKSPVLSKTYPMDSPYGLGIDRSTLFICEGTNGLRTYNASNPLDLQLNAYFKDLNSFDVIPLKGTLLMIGKDGLYQFDYSDSKNLKLLSKIPVITPTT